MGNSYKASCARLGRAVICNFWHLGTLTSWASECPDVKNYNTNDGLTHMATVSGKGPKYQTEWESHNNSLPAGGVIIGRHRVSCQPSRPTVKTNGSLWTALRERRNSDCTPAPACHGRSVAEEQCWKSSDHRISTDIIIKLTSTEGQRTDAWSTPSDLNECTLSVLCPCQHSIGDMGDGFYR